jgi:hypothetical protein
MGRRDRMSSPLHQSILAEEDAMPLWFRIVRLWLPIAIATTVVILFTSVAVQQAYRMTANDPQIQLAEDAVARLDSGDQVADVLPDTIVNAASSLAPFVIVYDAQNAVLDGSGVLEGAPPVPPVGVLDTARANGQNAVTWQPASDVRIASVSVSTRDGRVVLAGRSLREVEIREDQLNTMMILSWIAAMAGSLFACVAGGGFARHRQTTT